MLLIILLFNSLCKSALTIIKIDNCVLWAAQILTTFEAKKYKRTTLLTCHVQLLIFPCFNLRTCHIFLYKITKRVHALWLAERSVCMRLCKHSCVLELFCFSHTNHASRNLKKFSSSKLDKLLYLPIPSLVETLKIFTNKLCQFIFSLKLIF